MALAVVALWFGLVAVYLVLQWWVSELEQARDGVSAPAPVTLPATCEAQVMGPAVPAFSWSALHVAGSAAR